MKIAKEIENGQEIGIPSNALSTYLKKKDKIFSSLNGTAKNRKITRGTNMNGGLLKRFKEAQNKSILIRDPITTAKVNSLPIHKKQ